MGRTLYVDMEALLDALGTGEPSLSFVLDLDTGRVDRILEGDEPAAAEQALVPRRAPADEVRMREAFAAEVEDDLARERLRRAAGDAAAFHAALGGHPDLRARFLARRRAVLLDEALAWLRGLAIEPRYELRPLEAPQPLGAAPAEPRVSLFDLLLLGASAGAGETRAGCVLRRVHARDAEQAQRIFRVLARELAEHHGVAPAGSPDGQEDLVLGRTRLERRGGRVDLWVEVPPAVRRLFAREEPEAE